MRAVFAMITVTKTTLWNWAGLEEQLIINIKFFYRGLLSGICGGVVVGGGG